MSMLNILSGALIGVLNGFFGAGGGMLAVPLLKKQGLNEQQAHATSIAIILPLCAVSAFLYSRSDHVRWQDVLPYIPGGLLGAVAGGLLMKKISPKWLRRIFGILMIYSAWRLFFS